MAYQIIRYHQNGPSEVVKTVNSLAAAQEHCQRADTRGEGWFDGYRKVDYHPLSGSPLHRRAGFLETAIGLYVGTRGA